MEQFLEFAAEIFEEDPENLSLETDFRKEVEDFSSLMGFSLICMMEDEYGVQVTQEKFKECKTIGDLYRLCSEEQ